MDRLDRLRLFALVADRGSFVDAARSLRISPTAASRAIQALEQELGALLLHRTTRAVRLTPEGAAYLERSRHALAELDDAAQALRGERAEPRGLLVISAPLLFGRMHMRPLASELVAAHPNLSIRLNLTDRLVSLAEEGIDAAVRIAELSDSALHAVPLGQVRLVLAASPAYLERHGTPRSVADLRNHSLIVFESFARNGEWRFGEGQTRVLRLKPRLMVDAMEPAIDAAVAGEGVTRALSYQVVEDVEAGRLRLILPEAAPRPIPINLVFQAARRGTPNLRALIEATRRRFQSVRLDVET